MKSLRLVGVSDAPIVFETVWRWRIHSLKKVTETVNAQSKKARRPLFNLSPVCHGVIQVVIESTFLESAVQLLEDKTYSCEVVLSNCTAEMEKIAFHWAMSVDQVHIRSEMAQFRRNIQSAVPKIIGALARGRLEAISALLFREIEEKKRQDIAVRPELLSLCDAMKEIKLSFENETLFAASLNLIQHADPLKHNAQLKKSQVRHCMCSMLSAWLHPLAESDALDFSHVSSEHVQRWYDQIDLMLERLRNWAEEKTKHYGDGFPLIVDLWCLQKDANFIENSEKVMKMLKKVLKWKECRALAIRCLTQCARVALSRLGNRKQAQEKSRLDEWLERIVPDVVQIIKKGPIPTPELHDLMVRLCVTVGWHRPVFATDAIIMPLIQHDQMDKITISFRSVLELMFMAVAQHPSSKPDDVNLRQTMVSLEANELEFQLLEYIHAGNQALSLLKLDDRRGQFSKEIGRLFRGFDTSTGVGLLTHRSSMNDNTKDTSIGLNVVAWTLRLIPYILPDGPKIEQLVRELAQHTGHGDTLISSVAFRSLKNILIGMPSIRYTVVRELSSSILHISHENREAIMNGLRNLQILLEDWLAMADEPIDDGAPSTHPFTASVLEGKMLVVLCSIDPQIRQAAFKTLDTIRNLDRALRNAQQMTHEMSLHRDSSISKLPFPSALLDSGGMTSQNPFSTTTYVMDFLEEMGNDVAHKVYWDFYRHSDLHRRWKSVPENISLEDVLYSKMDGKISSIRLARCLSAISIEASALCPQAFEEAYNRLTNKLHQFTRSDTPGRPALMSDVTDNISLDLLRNYFCFATACPPPKIHSHSPPPPNGDPSDVSLCFLARGTFSTETLDKILLGMLTAGSGLQEIAVTALGNCHPDSYEILAKMIQSVVTVHDISKERNRSKQTTKSKMEEIRMNIANIFRIIADKMPRGTLRFRKHLKLRFLEFVENTMLYVRQQQGHNALFETIAQLPPDASALDMLHLCYCLSSVAANAGPELTSTSSQQECLTVEMRHALFRTLQQCNAPGDDSGDFLRSRSSMRHSVLSKLKDVDSSERYDAEMEKACRYLEVASCLAMVSMLDGPSWDTDRRTNNPIFIWVDYLLKRAEPCSHVGPSNISIARQALTKLILSNLTLFDGYVNKCYNPDQQVSSVYFQVVCEVYCSYEVKAHVHVILSLVLYKCVDANPQVREDALHLLKCLSHREWGGKCTTGWALWFRGHSIEEDVVVIGSLQDTCQSFQYQLSESLAREHPEVNELLCEELMTMQCNDVVNPAVLVCLMPWMEQLTFSHSEDSKWSDRLLKSMYYVTSLHGKLFSHEIERLWTTIASKSNVRPILTFLVGFAVNMCALQDSDQLAEYHSVIKRISLYLARASPHRTIDHLVSEAAKMMQAAAVFSVEGENSIQSSMPLKFSASSNSSAQLLRKRDGSASSQIEMARPSEMSLSGSLRHRPPSFTTTAPVHHRDRTYASNVSISMQSDGSYEEGFKSDAPTACNPKVSVSNLSALGGNRRGSEVVPPLLKGLLQRADVAVCMLSEIAYERGDKFSDHMPLLFHLCVICMDSLEPVVRLHCQQLVINLLNVLLAKRVGVPGKANKLSALVAALQSMKGHAPWPYEDTNLNDGRVLSEAPVSFFVSGLLEATSDGSNLKDLWIKEALTWAVESSNRHLSCRSFQVARHLFHPSFPDPLHQVLRGLQPTASSEAFISLVRCLKECFVRPSETAMECVLEILETMKMLMYNAEASKLVLYPQLFWVCITLLNSDFVHIYRLVLELLHCLLEAMKISNDSILNVLLATTPTTVNSVPVKPAPTAAEDTASKAEGKEIQTWDLGTKILLPAAKSKDTAVLCIQHLLIKGLYLDQTENVTVRLFSRLAAELVLTPEVTLDSYSYMDDMCTKKGEHSGISILVGSVQVQISVSLASVIPWTCQRILSGTSVDGPGEVCDSLAEACCSERLNTVGSTLIDLTGAERKSLSLSLTRLADALCDELPGQALSLIIGYWLGLLRNKDHCCTQISLMLLRSIFERCKNPNTFELGNLPALRVTSNTDVFTLISSHLQGSNAVEASEVLAAIVACSSLSIKPPESIHSEQARILTRAMEVGMKLHQLVPFNHDHTAATIDGVLSTCPQHLRKPSGKDFMPFLKEHQQTGRYPST